jgi:ABC-2 type transport system permease protein
MANGMRYFGRLLTINLSASFALRSAFFLQAGFMALNNLLFFCFWWIMFTRFDSIRGWGIQDVAILFGVSAAGYGSAAVVAGGLNDLARQIDAGELDPLLTQPKNVLLQAIVSRTRPDGWGDVVSGVALIALSGYLQWSTLPMAVLAVGLAATMFVATGVLAHCTAFWFGNTEALARQVSEFLITFSVYPPGLFGGPLKFILFTVLPAGFISYLPVALVRQFSGEVLVMALGGVFGFSLLAVFAFGRGLRRYESGNRFGVRG